MGKNTENKRKMKNNKKKNDKNIKKKSKIWGKILILLFIILIALIARIVYRTQQNGGGMTGLLSTLVGHDEETLKNLDPIQVLLMGISTDERRKINRYNHHRNI